MARQRKVFIVRCTYDEHARLVERAARFGYASTSSRASRPGVARYLVDRGLSDGVILRDEDRNALARIVWELRGAGVHLERLSDGAARGASPSRQEVEATLERLRGALRVLASVCDGSAGQ